MSEQLVQELHQAKVSIAQISARLAANEQFTNGVIKDLIETKTNLNLYMQAHQEVSTVLNEANTKSEADIKELTAKNELLAKELEEFKNPPSCSTECAAVMDSSCEAA